MKTNTLLFIASLAVLTTGASAASNQNESDIVVLPTYVVSTPRYLPVEREINASLKELSQQAGAPQAIAPELTVLKQAATRNPLAEASRIPAPMHIAKS
jgi:hypothetical protein